MNRSATQLAREWLESDLMAFEHLKHCLKRKAGPEQIAQFLKAVVNGVSLENEGREFHTDEVDWLEIGNEAPSIFLRWTDRILHRPESFGHAKEIASE